MKTQALFAVLAVVPASVWAQSYNDLTLVRDRPSPFASVLAIRAGVLGGLASDQDETIGLEDVLGWDGFVYFRQDRFGGKEARLEAYAGRDGAYLGVLEGGLLGGGSQSRLEVTARYFPFYREGFYRNGDFVPSGQYEGRDYGVQFSVAQEMAEGLRMEIGTYYRRMTFGTTAATASYVIPDDYNSIGGRIYLEHNTLTLDRVGLRPRSGFIMTVIGEYERNDSGRLFGVPGVFESTLPDQLWRARGHLEWYLPQSDAVTWRINIDGSLSDDEDRVNNYDAQKPVGHAWVDGSLGMRFDLGRAFAVTPYLSGQLVRILQEDGVGSDQETFFGGGVDLTLDFGDSMSIVGAYSYLSNESRAPISTSRDTLGEHQLFLGMEVRFAAARR